MKINLLSKQKKISTFHLSKTGLFEMAQKGAFLMCSKNNATAAKL